MNRILFTIAVLFFAISQASRAQPDTFVAGIETQVYPAGVIPSLHGELIKGHKHGLHLRVGYNITDRGDFGEHDNEEGGGPGFGAGYRFYPGGTTEGLFAGIRADVWFMEIDWEDFGAAAAAGTTDITVFQPTVEAGYDFLESQKKWRLAVTLSLGAEFNIRTDGEEVGEGAILLGGINLGRRF